MNPIQFATIQDIPELCSLLALLFTQEKDFQPNEKKQSAALNKIIENPAIGRILVFREDNKIIGMVNLLFTISTACGGKVALLEDMIIHPSRHNDGLGSKLLQAAKTLAEQEGCHRITLLTDHTNNSAMRFYRRYGFEQSEMAPFRINIPAA